MKPSRLPMDLRIALLYVLFGGIWIFASDYLMELWIHDELMLPQLEVVKGLIFVTGTSVLIYFLSRREHLRHGMMESELRRAEKTAAQSRARFSTIFHASPAPIAISRLVDQHFIEVNEAFLGLTGYGLTEIIDHTPHELALWVDPTERQRLIELLKAKGRVDGMEFRLRHRSGSVLEMQLWAELIELDGEQCMLNIAHNITERKHVERLLRESEQRFRTALNSMLEGCQIVDFDWRYIYVNEAAARQGGRRPEDLLMRTMSEAYPGIEKSVLFHTLRNCMWLRVPAHLETELCITNHFSGCFQYSIQPVPEGLFILSMDISERKQTEAAFKAAEEKYRTIFDGAVEGIFQSTPEGRFITVNPAFARMWGYDSPQDMMETVQDIASQVYADPERRLEYRRAMHEHGEVHGFEFEARRKDGTPLWVLENARVVKDEAGNILYYEGNIQDITERRQIRIERERLLHTVEASLNEIYIFDVKTLRFQYVNAGAQHNLGYSFEQLRSMTPLDLQPQLSEETFRGYLSPLLLGTQNIIVLETTHRRADGSLYPVEVHVQLVERDGDQVFLAIINDITERTRAQQSLRESEQRYRTLAEAAQEMIYIIDTKGKIDYVNEYGAHQFGYKPGQMIGKSLQAIFSAPGVDTRWRNIQSVLQSGDPAYFENPVQVGSEILWLGTSLVPIRNEGEDITGVMGVSRDITWQKRAAADLQRSEERYRGLFEDSPIALWEEDFSMVKRRLDELRTAGVTDFRAYFEANRSSISECIRLIKVLDVNKAALAAQNVTTKEELLSSLDTVLGEDAGDGFMLELLHIAEGRLNFSWEGINYTRTGQRRDVSLNWSVSPGHETDLSKVIVSIIDITERKQAEVALKVSEARYRGLFEDSPIALREEDFSGVKRRLDDLKRAGVVDFDAYLSRHPDVVAECAALAQVVDVNNATLRQYGATSKQQMPKSLSDILEGEAFEHFAHQLACLANGQTHFSWEGRDKKLDGTPIHVQAGWSVAPGHEHDLSKVIVSVLDITERKQAEKALRASEEKYRKLFSEMFSGCALHEVICDDGGQAVDYVTVDINDSFERLMDVPKAQIIGKRASEILPPDELNQWLKIFGAVALDGRSTHYEMFSPLNGKQFEGNAFCPEKGKFAVTFTDITERKNSEAKIQQQLKRITALRDIDRIITSSLDLRLTLNRLLAHVIEQLQLSAAAILLFDPHTFTLQYFTSRGLAEREIPDFRTSLTNELASRVAMEQKPLRVDLTDWRLPSGEQHPLAGQSFVAYWGLPLIAKGKLCGVLEVYHRSPLSYDAEWFNYLDTLAGQAAIAIDNIQMFDGLQRSNIELARAYDATIEGWSRALDMRDRETEGHTQRVTELTTALAREFGFRAEELVNIRWGALLHDIGKMGIPDSILLKPGPLTDEEWVKMKQHPELAYQMLSSIQYLRNALDIPHYHHEKWDGTGYPTGLKGEQIPLAARIFAIADVWDALRSDRPYRPAWPARKALSYIRKISGTQLDPKVVDVFLTKRIYDLKTPPR